jgi:hypothetical protein
MRKWEQNFALGKEASLINPSLSNVTFTCCPTIGYLMGLEKIWIK